MSHEAYMRQALALATRGLGRTAPNPAVGAVVVRDGQIVGQGWHRRAGELHAERVALQDAGERAQGADLYCTLEPCCHYGRTPPCTAAIIEAGITRVYYGSFDPDPRCAGQGEETLRAAGIEVMAGLLRAEADRLNEGYFHHKRTGRPWLTLKLACSLDGKVATAEGDARWVTGEASRQLVHTWRDQTDAMLVGIGTVLADDPALTARGAKQDDREPQRVVVDSLARTCPKAQVVAGAGSCLIAVTEAAPQERISTLQAAGATVLTLPAVAGQVDLLALLAELGERQVMSVLCEGGPTLAASLVRQGLVNRYRLFYAPKWVGAEGRSALGDLGLRQMAEALPVTVRGVEQVGEDILVTAAPCLPD